MHRRRDCSFALHHLDADQCSTDIQCNDTDITTEDVCVGTPKHCENTKVDCADIGETCVGANSSCNGTIMLAADTAYCCIGKCLLNVDLFIEDIGKSSGYLEVEIGGLNTVLPEKTFRIAAYENGTAMATPDGAAYAVRNGRNSTPVYFNFTINITGQVNFTAIVDTQNSVNETNESNNNMTKAFTLP